MLQSTNYYYNFLINTLFNYLTILFDDICNLNKELISKHLKRKYSKAQNKKIKL